MDIPRTTAQGRIRSLEQEGYVVGYVPWVSPDVFGSPYLIEVRIDPRDYPDDVRVDERYCIIKGETQNCIGRVLSNSGQS